METTYFSGILPLPNYLDQKDYIDGNIQKPGPESIPLPSETTTVQSISTPISSSTPTLDEWTFRDQLARGHVTLNCIDVASLGVVTTRTAKEAWDSIQTEWGKSTDMWWSHAQEALNWTEYVEGTEIQDHIMLCSRCVDCRRTLSVSCVRLWQEFRQLESKVSN